MLPTSTAAPPLAKFKRSIKELGGCDADTERCSRWPNDFCELATFAASQHFPCVCCISIGGNVTRGQLEHDADIDAAFRAEIEAFDSRVFCSSSRRLARNAREESNDDLQR